MPLGKQAKTLSRGQVDAMLAYLSTTRHAKRNRLIFLLSVKAGLRAKEIAKLTWWMTNDSEGQIGWEICLLNFGQQGQVRPTNTPERGGQDGADRVSERGDEQGPSERHELCRTFGDKDGAVPVHVPAGDREHVPEMVPTPRLRRLFKPQWQEDVHYQRGPEDLDGRRVVEGRPGASRSTSSIAVMFVLLLVPGCGMVSFELPVYAAARLPLALAAIERHR